jgi:hypothetical protein
MISVVATPEKAGFAPVFFICQPVTLAFRFVTD